MARHQVLVFMFMILAGWGIAAAFTYVPQQHHVSGETTTRHETTDHPFLPLYLDIISGKVKPRDVCEVHTLEELLMPCETHR